MSTNTKHTPGPWAISRHATPEYAPQCGVYSEADDAGRDLAIAKGSNAEANAALIAAAPELLEAANLLRQARDAMLDERLDDLRGILCGDVCADILEIAAKARGVA